MNKKKIVGFAVGAVLLIGGFIYMNGSEEIESDAAQPVTRTAVVTQGDIIIDFVSDGNVEIPIYDLSFESTGTIKTINVKAGDYVEAGTVLAELEKDDLERDLLKAELDLEVALKQQKLNATSYSGDEENYAYNSDKYWNAYETVKDTLDIMMTIPDAYSDQEVKDQQTLVNDAYEAYTNYVSTSRPNTSLEAELDAITVEKARMSIEEIEESIEGMIIKANVNGWIVDVNYAAGEVTESAESVILIEEDGPIYVETSVAEEDISDVSVGQKANFEADAVAGITYGSLVEHVSRSPEIGSNGLVTYNVLLKADEIDRSLMDGMTTTVNFILIERTDVLILPNKAITKKEGGQYVTVKSDDGTLEERKIFAGFTDGSQVEILSGLEVGETVVYEE